MSQVTVSEFCERYNNGEIDYLNSCVVTSGDRENELYSKDHHLVEGGHLVAAIGNCDDFDFEGEKITLDGMVIPCLNVILEETGALHDDPEYMAGE